MAAAYHGTESRSMRALEVLALYDGHHGMEGVKGSIPFSSTSLARVCGFRVDSGTLVGH
jgi:hypothetical protein